MQLSIIIVNYNAAPFLELCLHSVFKAIKNLHAQVIVVDNNSADHSVQMVRERFKDVQLIVNQFNLGFSKANNIGVAAAQGEYLCILNPDTLVGEQVFDELFAFAKANPKTAFTTTQLIDGAGNFLPESKRNVPTPKVARQKLGGNSANYYASHLNKEYNGQVDILVGACMFCKKEVYEQLGGFDTRYFMYGEDIDLSYTALQNGFSNYYMGTQKILHFKGESTVIDANYYKRFYGAMALFYDKYFKRNLLEKFAVTAATKLFVLLKPRKRPKVVVGVSQKILVSNDVDFHLPGVDKRVNVASLETQELPAKTQIIWDVRSLKCVTIINFMASNTGKQLSYRFLSPQRDFLLGSDNSTDRGVVLNLAD